MRGCEIGVHAAGWVCTEKCETVQPEFPKPSAIRVEIGKAVLVVNVKLLRHGRALTIAQWQEMDWQALYLQARFCVEAR